MTSKICPICRGDWYDTHKFLNLCSTHSHTKFWIVTRCLVCGCFCFSTEKGLCPTCAELTEDNPLEQTEVEKIACRNAG